METHAIFEEWSTDSLYRASICHTIDKCFFCFTGEKLNIEEIVKLALREDIGYGDITTESLDFGHKSAQASLIAKEEGVLAGLDVALSVFKQLDPDCNCIAYYKDGDCLKKSDVIARVSGRASKILQAERVALNLLQRMSGIATITHKMVEAIKPYPARLLDTRKTTPLLRELEKYAVRVGGGFNHRFGLFDMVMLKENHIRSAGSITIAVERVRKRMVTYKIEVEVTNLKELDEAAACGVDRIMLDNMSVTDMKKAVKKYGGKVELEASGNVSLETVNKIAATGVDYISSGMITHSYTSLDISLLFKE